MEKIVIVGAGGFGKEVAWLIERINSRKKQYEILGYVDDGLTKGQTVSQYSVIGNIYSLNAYDEDLNICIAIGDASLRKKLVDKIKKIKNFKFPNLVDPSAIVSVKKLGCGNIICANNVFTIDYKLDDFNIINLSCTIGHDVIIKSFVTIYPGVNVSGNVHIKQLTEIGTGAKIIQGKTIEENVIIGAGSVIVSDLESDSVYVGIPAKKIKEK